MLLKSIRDNEIVNKISLPVTADLDDQLRLYAIYYEKQHGIEPKMAELVLLMVDKILTKDAGWKSFRKQNSFMLDVVREERETEAARKALRKAKKEGLPITEEMEAAAKRKPRPETTISPKPEPKKKDDSEDGEKDKGAEKTDEKPVESKAASDDEKPNDSAGEKKSETVDPRKKGFGKPGIGESVTSKGTSTPPETTAESVSGESAEKADSDRKSEEPF
jgi:hypothetical protein